MTYWFWKVNKSLTSITFLELQALGEHGMVSWYPFAAVATTWDGDE